jgi:hypothetical protein
VSMVKRRAVVSSGVCGVTTVMIAEGEWVRFANPIDPLMLSM